MPNYGLGNAIKAAAGDLATTIQLANGNQAALLPQDTKFAIAIQAIQRNLTDSFWETDTAGHGLVSMEASAEGMVGRFDGYLSFSDTKIRIFSALDVNAAAKGQPQASDFTPADTPGSLHLLLEDDIANMTISMQQGNFVISNATQKFKLIQPYPIKHTEGRFETSAFGFDNGFSPTFKYMRAHGAKDGQAPKGKMGTSVVLQFLYVFIIIAAIVAYSLYQTHRKR